MKSFFLVLFLALGLVACNDFEDENYDFSNALAQYVELTSGSISSLPDTTASVSARVRVALQSPVNVEFSISGDFSESGTITIPAGETSGSALITIPAAPETGTATLEITGVDNGLDIGRGGADSGLSATEATITWAP